MTVGRLAAALACLALALAGCLGSEEDPPTDVTPQACDDCGGGGGPPSTASDPCDANASCASPEPAVIKHVPFEYVGTTGGGVCPPPVVRSHCTNLQEASGEAPVVSTAGQPLWLNADVSAEARTPLAQDLYVSVVVDRGDGWEWDPEREPGETAAAPFSVSWDLSQYPPGTKFMFWVETGESTGPVTWSTPHDFQVQGELTGHAD